MIDAQTAHKIGDILSIVEEETGMKLNARLRDEEDGTSTLCLPFLGRDVTVSLNENFDAKADGSAIAQMMVSFVRQNVTPEVFLFISNVMEASNLAAEGVDVPAEEAEAASEEATTAEATTAEAEPADAA